jgi:hypothetical protein
MIQRFVFVCLFVFWATMNVLLWRAEFGNRPEGGTQLPASIVWQKMLTAPDNSSLEIYHRGQRLGTCRWAANVGEESKTGVVSSEEPEGLVERLTGYTVDFDGNVMIPDIRGNTRFFFRASFDTNHLWKDMNFRFTSRPITLVLGASAAERQLTFRLDDEEEGMMTRTFRFEDLRNPRKILEELAGPLPLGLMTLALAGGGTNDLMASTLALGLDWEARNDSLTIGRTPVRIYRLQARLLDRFRVVVYVSRAGEVLRVELPDDLVLTNYALTTF